MLPVWLATNISMPSVGCANASSRSVNQGPQWLIPAAHTVQVQEDITDLTCADLFSEVGKRTPVATRFSTVTHERGSPESLRDVRGFSVRSGLTKCQTLRRDVP